MHQLSVALIFYLVTLYLALEKRQTARDKQNENRIKRLDFINKKLRETNVAKAYISNVNEPILEYYRIFAKQIKPLPHEPELSDFYHPSENQNMVKCVLFVTIGAAQQHMFFTSTHNRWQMRNYMRYTINPITFGLVARL